MTKRDDISAFSDKCDGLLYDGMSLRDWFAGQALAGMGTWSPADFEYATDHGEERQRRRAAAQAVHVYMVADAMLEARKK